MSWFKDELATCRLAHGCPPDEEFIEGDTAHNDKHGWDESGRDTRCAICRDELCACGDSYNCEHDTDERHGWSPLGEVLRPEMTIPIPKAVVGEQILAKNYRRRPEQFEEATVRRISFEPGIGWSYTVRLKRRSPKGNPIDLDVWDNGISFGAAYAKAKEPLAAKLLAEETAAREAAENEDG